MLEQKKTDVTEQQLASLYGLMSEHDDEINANKVLDLFDKISNKHFYVSFTGHFSAGKSSIINYLLEKELLPKSPIPTSANIVKITSGAGVARVFFNEQNPVEYDEPYDIDMIKDYCMNKDTIQQIEIHTSDNIVPKGTYIVDTPGIDAADDADRYMTESSLHLVDILYYVMDYNHVQSEINFTFLKQIQEKNIPIYIIINQIDKHNDEELSFNAFKDSVETSFEQWEINPERIYYSSIFAKDEPINELNEIKQDLFRILNNENDTKSRIVDATEQIISSHRQFLEDRYTESINDLSDNSFDELKWDSLTAKIEKLSKRPIMLEKEFLEEIEQTLKNAYLMPAKLRDLAQIFLESQQTSFKVGFFQAKKKTEIEKQTRLNHFLEELQQTVQSTIVWKLREKFAQLLQHYQIANENLRQHAQQFSVNISEQLLFSALKKGATVNGNYVLNYTNEISNKIKQLCKSEANHLLTNMKVEMNTHIEKQLEQLNIEKSEMERMRVSSLKRGELENSLQQKLILINQSLDESVSNDEIIDLVRQQINYRYNFIKEVAPFTNSIVDNKENENYKVTESVHVKKENNNITTEQIITQIDRTIATINDLPDFQALIDELQSKRARIQDRTLTVALFGAFSAGKSSFSNALLGQRILPVSPNPTTAVINRIRPTTNEYTNGTVMITYKSDEVLTEDLKGITKDFSPVAKNFEEFVAWIKRDKIYENEQLSNVYQSYLRAILDGYEERGTLLGNSEIISLDDFSAYVTDESIAAYIEAVDLYYDNELTRRGITLVDTPGANSVNARHTNVAFDYIKDADAILYVTYYNHAVTSADRDFLIQLGRVKESFELDKMFFIINAADLARDEAELSMVVDYVEEQLLQYGIRNPQVFPLSSKLSLKEKENNELLNEQMSTFENTFEYFIEHDLYLLTYEAAIWDMKRVQSRIKHIIHSAQLDEREKEVHIKQLRDTKQQANDLLQSKIVDNLLERTIERIERQLHFVNERVYIRFHDMFTEHFNPTTITENGRQAVVQLEKSRNQLVDFVGYELLQEVRAVSLRVEAFMNSLLKEHYEQIREQLKTIEQTITLPNYDERRFKTPLYVQAFVSINLNQFHQALKIFKNLRSFFEQNDREKMKEVFYETLKPEIESYLQEQQLIMKEHYVEQLGILFNEMLQHIQKEIATTIKQQINVLNTEIDFSKYSKKLDQMSIIVDNLKHENDSR